MKKFTKITYMTLASFTLLTGCKGKELTNEEAKEVIKPIVEAQRSAYDEETAWTITSVVNGTVAGEKEKEEYIKGSIRPHSHILPGVKRF